MASKQAKILKEIASQIREASTENLDQATVVNKLLKSRYAYLLEDATHTDIAYVLNTTVDRVKQIESAVLKKLKTPGFGKPLHKILSEHLSDEPIETHF